MELNDVLEDAQDFTYSLLRDYGYPEHELIELWFETNHQWEITLYRLNMAISLMDDLEELLGEKLTVEEADALKSKREMILRGHRHFDIFYQTADNFIVRELQYSVWLHKVYSTANGEVYHYSRHSSSDPWWNEQRVLSESSSDKLRELLVVDEAETQRALVFQLLKTAHERIVQRSSELKADTLEAPDVVLPLAELEAIFVSLEIDHMFFD